MRATDNGTPPRYTDHSLTINILDVNDNAPVVESPRGYNVSVSEVGSQAFDLLTFRSWLPGVRQPMVVTQRFVFSTFEECWKRDVGSPCGGYWQRHGPQRPAFLLHHQWEPRPDLPHGPHDWRNGDATGSSWPGTPAAVCAHGYGGGWRHATSVGKMWISVFLWIAEGFDWRASFTVSVSNTVFDGSCGVCKSIVSHLCSGVSVGSFVMLAWLRCSGAWGDVKFGVGVLIVVVLVWRCGAVLFRIQTSIMSIITRVLDNARFPPNLITNT